MSSYTKTINKSRKKAKELTFGVGITSHRVETGTKRKCGNYVFSAASNFYSPSEMMAKNIKDKIEQELKNGAVKEVESSSVVATQLSGKELLKFRARVIVRKYKHCNSFLKKMSKIIILTDGQINAIISIYENQIKQVEESVA